MSAEDLALVVAGGHVDVRVKLSVHGVYGAGEGDDLERTLKLVRVIFFLGRVENADGEIVRCAQRRDGSELNVLAQSKLADLIEYFLASVDACDYRVSESFVLHKVHFPFFLLPGFVFFLGLGFAQPLA